ncbi:MAG TPA: glycosyltransferase family 2 protein [Glaciihabitans sp.]|jgi:cellulose synthase/poly-beta-1,6-N-acetylglucosamine synthase-like glycosyltransferase|nr:glycosyltransferase family 2 protein [Glaciihabitans sp.]
MLPFLIFVIVLVGINTLLWAGVGIIRVFSAWLRQLRGDIPSGDIPTTDDVAVIIAAHNEEVVLGHSLRSLKEHISPKNIFVVSDGSSDSTVEIARAEGVSVLDLQPNRGKAGAIVELLSHFELPQRFEIVLLLDADTQLAPGYFSSGLPMFGDPEVVAVAGRAVTQPWPLSPTRIGRFLVAYRNRVYIAMQYLFKFGQAARYANVVSIVPGFASMYRSRILSSIDIDAPGLKIEDYNMTFEIHAKQLGRIAFHPQAAIALTQDPDHLRDYIHQVERWNLGFWQTVRRHNFRFRKFWLALSLFILELLMSSVLLILLLPLILISLTASLVVALGLDSSGTAQTVVDALPLLALVLGIVIPDYLLTIFAAIVSKNPKYLLEGLAFPVLRVLDAVLCMRALVAALLLAPSTGDWKSPARRTAELMPGAKPLKELEPAPVHSQGE